MEIALETRIRLGRLGRGGASAALCRARSLAFRHYLEGQIHCGQDGNKSFKSWVSRRRCGFVQALSGYACIPGDACHLTRLCDITDGLKKHLRGIPEGGVEVIRGPAWIDELLDQPRLMISGSVQHHSLRHVRNPSKNPALSRCPGFASFSYRRSTKPLCLRLNRSRPGSRGRNALSVPKLPARRDRDLLSSPARRA